VSEGGFREGYPFRSERAWLVWVKTLWGCVFRAVTGEWANLLGSVSTPVSLIHDFLFGDLVT